MDASIPIPKDLPLPLPVPEGLLVVLHVVFFAMHILFVNLMLGGAILTLIYEIRGRFRADYDALAREISKTITVNKSLAVVMGVGPLLIINLLYTNPFYSANAITGNVWMLIVPLVIGAFLLAYLHKYSWERMQGHKGLHTALIAAVVAILLSIPLIFLTNINLMLFPGRWPEVHGFLDALLLPNVIPRYLHFLLASLAVTGLFLVWWTGRAKFPAEGLFRDLTRTELKQHFYSFAFGASLLQFIAGPLVLATLPPEGLNLRTLAAVICGVACAIPALVWMWREMSDLRPGHGTRFWHILGAVTLTVVFMVVGRHLYRAEALSDYKAAMAAKTVDYQARVADAAKGVFHDPPPEVTPIGTQPTGTGTGTQPTTAGGGVDRGEAVFKKTCIACHAVGFRLIGPPITEIAKLYAGNAAGIAAWAKAPGKKRPDYPPMIAIPLPDDDLKAAGEYMLKVGAEPPKK